MSLITIQCDRCRTRRTLAVRQPHEARDRLEAEGWSSGDQGRGNRFKQGRSKEDYCPDCRTG